MKRILAFTLIFVMLFTAMLGIMPAAGTTEPATLDIAQANISFGSNVELLIAVNPNEAVADDSAIKLSVTNKAGTVKELIQDSTVSAPEGCVGFRYALSASELGDNLTLTAYVDGNTAVTDTATYSVLEYAIKAKASAGTTDKDIAFVAALAAMLDYGAAAQTAFGNAYDNKLNADNSESFGYGLVLVGGASEATRKSVVAIGASVTPAADTSVFATSGTYKLYDISFNPVTAATAAEGVSRYFYYGQDLYDGDHAAAYSSFVYNSLPLYFVRHGYVLPDTVTVDGLKQSAPLSFSSFNFEGKTNDTISLTSATWGTKIRAWLDYAYDKTTVTGSHYIFAVKDEFTAFRANNSANGLGYNSSAPWGIAKVSGDSLSSIDVTNNYMKLNVGSGQALQFFNNLAASPTAYLVDGKMTVSIAFAFDENATNYTATCGFAANQTNGGGQRRMQLFEIASDGTLTIGDTKYASGWSKAGYVNINSYDSAKNDFTVLHFVIDTNKNGSIGTLTVYTEDGQVITSGYGPAVDLVNYASSASVFHFAVNDSVYINRVTLSQGDIFN